MMTGSFEGDFDGVEGGVVRKSETASDIREWISRVVEERGRDLRARTSPPKAWDA